MNMYDPPHPGEFIRDVYLEELGISSRSLAARLKVASSTLTRLINGRSSISPEMALRLSATLGRSPESWLAMQNAYDLWQLRQRFKADEFEKLEVAG